VVQSGKDRIIHLRLLLAAMVLLQLFWLISGFQTGQEHHRPRILLLFVYTVGAWIITVYVTTVAAARIRALARQLLGNERRMITLLCLLTLGPGALYAAYQNVWPFDEHLSYVASQTLAQQGAGRFFEGYARAEWLGNQHPPLVVLINGFVIRFTGASIYGLRLLTLLFAAGTVVITYILGRDLYDRRTGLLAALLLLSFPLFFRLATVAITDAPVAFYFALALLLALRLARAPSGRLAVSLGMVVAAGMLTKYTMVLVLPVMLALLVLYGGLWRARKQLLVAGLIAASLVGLWILYAFQIEVAGGQQETLTHYAGLVLYTDYGRQLLLETVTVRLPSAVGTYNLPLLLLGAWHLLRQRSTSDRLLMLWIGTVSLVLLVTLPDHRYFVVIFPAAAIVAARALKSIPGAPARVLPLALLYCAGALYLYADWNRATHLFLR
jgi:4-amino-4-deoxy-L-arabinose transferase-like glycosyltransferase